MYNVNGDPYMDKMSISKYGVPSCSKVDNSTTIWTKKHENCKRHKEHNVGIMIQRTFDGLSADFGCWRPCAADCSRCVEMRRCAMSRVSGSPVSGTVPMKACAFAFALIPGAGGGNADAAGSIGDGWAADGCASTCFCAFGC